MRTQGNSLSLQRIWISMCTLPDIDKRIMTTTTSSVIGEKAGGAKICNFSIETVNFQQNLNRQMQVRQRKLQVPKISILPLNFHQIKVFSPKFCFFWTTIFQQDLLTAKNLQLPLTLPSATMSLTTLSTSRAKYPLSACRWSREWGCLVAIALSASSHGNSPRSTSPARQLLHRMHSWPAGKLGPGHWESRSRTPRSWEQDRDVWDALEATRLSPRRWRPCTQSGCSLMRSDDPQQS